MYEKVAELDQLRSASLSGSETYHASSTICAQFNINSEVKKVVDSTPVLTNKVAEKLAGRATEKVLHATTVSICGKIQSQECLSISDMMEYDKSQKKDTYYAFVAPI